MKKTFKKIIEKHLKKKISWKQYGKIMSSMDTENEDTELASKLWRAWGEAAC